MPSVGLKIVQPKQMGEDELPAQGKFIVQKKGLGEEEDLAQMKAAPAQLQGVEDDELQKKPFQLKVDTVQRQVSGEDDELQKKPFQLKTGIAQRQVPGEDELMQGKFIPVQKKANTTGLPDNLKSGVENLSGIDISDVKVHYSSAKPAQLQALAYAQGTDIHVGPGQEKHLPHEAWHVVQQKQGRVQPTVQMKEGVAVNDDKGLETEADVMGEAAFTVSEKNLSNESGKVFQQMKNSSSDTIVQRKLVFQQEALSVQAVKQWLMNGGYTAEMLRKYTPEIIEEVKSNDVIRLAEQGGQHDYLDDLVRRANAKGVYIFPREIPLSETTVTRRLEFDRLFESRSLEPKQHLEQWVDVPKTGEEGSKFDDKKLDLYKRIQAHLLNPGLVFKVLNELNNYIKLIKPETLTGGEWHKEMLGGLSKSGFSQSPPEITELLQPDDFMHQTTGSGNLPLDTGADEKYYETEAAKRVINAKKREGPSDARFTFLPKHGALSHTIQWLIIQEGIKMQPEVISLLQLFADTAKYSKYSEHLKDDKTPFLWSSLVDLPPIHGFVVNATMPEGLTTLINACFPEIKAIEDGIEKEFLASMAEKGKIVYNAEGPQVKPKFNSAAKPINKNLMGFGKGKDKK